jgi:hypothetical protein
MDGTVVEVGVGEGDDIGSIYDTMETIHGEQQAAKQKATLQQFNSHIDTSPRQPPTPPGDHLSGLRERRGLNVPEPPTQDAPDRWLMMKNAAEKGIDVTSGLPPAVRAQAKLVGSGHSDRELATVDYFVRKQYRDLGINLPDGAQVLFIDENSGEPGYLRPEPTEDGGFSMVPTIINPVGLEGGDIIAWTPVAGQIVLETLGSLGGAVAGAAVGGPGNLGAMSLGAAIGSGTMSIVSNLARQHAARMMGVPEELVEKIRDDDMLHDALFAAGGDLVFGAGYKIFRAIDNSFFRPLEPKSPEELNAIRKEFIDRADTFHTFNDVLGLEGAASIRPTVEMLADNAETVVMGGQMRQTAKDGAGRAVAINDMHNRFTFGTAIRRINDRLWPTSRELSRPPSQIGTDAGAIIREPVEAVARRHTEAVIDLRRGMDGLPAGDINTWEAVQKAIREGTENLQAAEEAAWSAFRGPSGIQVDPATGLGIVSVRNSADDPIRKFVEKMERQTDSALAPVVSSSKEDLLRAIGMDEASIAKAIEEGIPNLMDDVLDLNQLHILSSHLKARLTKMADAIPGWSRRDVGDLVSAIDNQIHRSPLVYTDDYRAALASQQQAGAINPGQGSLMPHTSGGSIVGDEKASGIRRLFNEANDATREKYKFENLAALTDAAQVRQVPGSRTEYEFVRGRDTVRNTFLRGGNTDALEELKHVYGESPALKSMLQKELLAKFRHSAQVDGKWVQAAADRFLHDHEAHMKILFGESVAKDIRHIQHMADAVRRYEGRVVQVQSALESAFGRKFSGAEYSGDIVRDIIQSKTLTGAQTSRLAARLRRADPALWEDVQKQGLAWIEEGMKTGKTGKELKWGGLVRALEPRNAEKLTAIYGKQYVDNLQVVKDAFEQMGNVSMSRGYPQNVQTIMLQTGRALMGPLSKKQRFLTSMNRLLNTASNAEIRKHLSNPNTLDRWVKLHDFNPGTFPAAKLALELPLTLYEALEQETQERADLLRQLYNQGGPSPGFYSINDSISGRAGAQQ